MWKFNTCSCFDLLVHIDNKQNCHRNLNGFFATLSIISHLTCTCTFECHFEHLVFLGIGFSFMKLISSSNTSTKRGEVAILKNCPSAIITSPEVIIAEYDAILGQWERENFYDRLSNNTNAGYRQSRNGFWLTNYTYKYGYRNKPYHT